LTFYRPSHRPTTHPSLPQYSQKFGGDKATSLVSYSKDPAVIAICETWAGDYDSSAVEALGFQVDSRETGYEDAVRDFVEELKKD
jgi:hypothetical protein